MTDHENSNSDRAALYRPGPEVLVPLLEQVYRGEADLHIKVELTDMRRGERQTVFLHWDGGDVHTLIEHLRHTLNASAEDEQLEDLFWVYWRGWSGFLDSDFLANLPAVTPDLVDMVDRGVPLRGSDLRRFQAALEWAYANAGAEWGSSSAWQDGTISPPHLGRRKGLAKYIDQRMSTLYGPEYVDAPVR